MNDVLGWEPTELAVLNGDLLSAEAVGKDNYTEYIGELHLWLHHGFSRLSPFPTCEGVLLTGT